MTPQERFDTNRPLAFWVANRYRDMIPASDQLDLENAALVGLWRACLRYDEGRGARFSGFAVACITNEIRQHIRSTYRKVPFTVISLDEPVPDTEGLTIADMIGYEPDLGERVVYQELAQIVRDVGGRELAAMLIGGQPAAVVARKAGVSPSQISRRRSKAIRRVRQALAACV